LALAAADEISATVEFELADGVDIVAEVKAGLVSFDCSHFCSNFSTTISKSDLVTLQFCKGSPVFGCKTSSPDEFCRYWQSCSIQKIVELSMTRKRRQTNNSAEKKRRILDIRLKK
jgi:hypothetical protein